MPPGAFWGAREAREVAMKIVQRPPVPSQVAGANAAMLPQGFDEWFKRCVHLEPTRRFARASEATNELVTLLDQLLPKPSTALGGAVKTFLVGATDPTPEPAPVSAPKPGANPAPMPSPMSLPTPAPMPAPQRPAPRVLETALAIPDHELSHIPPAPRASGGGGGGGGGVNDAPAIPKSSNALLLALVVMGVILLAVVVILVLVLAKK
jgi:hypothetical protein